MYSSTLDHHSNPYTELWIDSSFIIYHILYHFSNCLVWIENISIIYLQSDILQIRSIYQIIFETLEKALKADRKTSMPSVNSYFLLEYSVTQPIENKWAIIKLWNDAGSYCSIQNTYYSIRNIAMSMWFNFYLTTKAVYQLLLLKCWNTLW